MSQSRQHTLEVQSVDGVAVVKLTEAALEEANLQAVGEQLLHLVDEQGHDKLHVDLGSVKYVPSMGLAKFVSLHRKMKEKGGHLTLCNVRDAVYEVFQVTRLHTVLDIRQEGVA